MNEKTKYHKRSDVVLIALLAAAAALPASAAAHRGVPGGRQSCAPLDAPAAAVTSPAREGGAAQTVAAKATATTAPAKTAAPKSVTSISDLLGDYVLTCDSVCYLGYESGQAVYIEAVEGTDSVIINNFWYDDAVTAIIDLDEMTITIPNQRIGYSTDYTSYYEIALCTPDDHDTPDRDGDVVGTIASDGTITITSEWGIYFTMGTYKDDHLGAYRNTVLRRPNGTMSYDRYLDGDTITYTFGIIAAQEDKNTLSVVNFYNNGKTVNITLNGDYTSTIESQVAYTADKGDFYTYSAVYYSGFEGLSRYEETITCDTASDYRAITWNHWNMLCMVQGNGGYSVYWSGRYLISGRIETDFDISYPTLGLNGSGTADDPYTISTPAEWNELADYVSNYGDSMTDKYVKLTNDIDFTGVTLIPIDGGLTLLEFDGDFGGGGYTISNINVSPNYSVYGALMYQTGENSHIHDLTVSGTVLQDNSYKSTAGLFGIVNGKLTNITSKVNITSDGGTGMLGGIAVTAEIGSVWENCVFEGTISGDSACFAGLAVNGRSGAKFINCGNKGTITYYGKRSYVAGLVYTALADTFINCYNTGKIITPNGAYVAGLVAVVNAAASSSSRYSYFEGCYNTSDISCAGPAGGLFCNVNGYTNMTMIDCYNTGDITSTSYNAAGIGALGPTMNSTYTGCWNSGKITGGTSMCAGGLFGRYYDNATSVQPVTISGCYNTGDVYTPGFGAGGIIGYMTRYVTIDSCYNTGNITADLYGAGGIVGYNAGSHSYVYNSWNTGDVISGYGYAGGITGYDYFTSSVAAGSGISGCFNGGNVTSLSSETGTDGTAAGYAVGGIAGYSVGDITGSFNRGTVTGAACVGGILGATAYYKKTVYGSITDCYNTGKVVATADSCGNILGNSLTDNGATIYSDYAVTGNYYLASVAVSGSTAASDTASVPLTYAQLAALDMGSQWTNDDDNSFPRPAALADNDYAKAYTAAVVPLTEEETYDAITSSTFAVGRPDGVSWSCSPEGTVNFWGNTAYFASAYTGTLVVTATAGDASASIELVCDISAEGVSDSQADPGRSLVSETLYTTDGRQVAQPADGTKTIYIVRRVYSDGTVTTVKEAR